MFRINILPTLNLKKLKILILFQPQDGGTNLLLNRAKEWFSNNSLEVIDVSNCVELENKNIDLVLLPTSEMHRLPKLWNQNVKIKKTLIWAMGSLAFQGAFINQMNVSFVYKKITLPVRYLGNKILSSFIADKSVIFTDEVGMYADMQFLKYKPTFIDDLIFPIAIDVKHDVPPPIFHDHPRNFMWLGRVDKDFKVLPLLKIIRNVASALSRGVLRGPITFTIIGTGDGADLVQNEISLTTEINFKWKNRAELSELQAILTNNIDVLIAMGTSALEGARFGIPTVIVQPFSHQEQEPELAYRWIHQTVGHSLGEFPWVLCEPVQPKCDFDSLWDVGTLDELSLKALAFSQKFNSDYVFSRLINRPLFKVLSPKSILLLRIHSVIYNLKSKLRELMRWLRDTK